MAFLILIHETQLIVTPKPFNTIIVVISRYPCEDLRAGSFGIDVLLSHLGIRLYIVKSINVLLGDRINLAQAKIVNDAETR